jgi:formylglycine-generating enzyme
MRTSTIARNLFAAVLLLGVVAGSGPTLLYSQASGDEVVLPAEIGELDLRFRQLLKTRVTGVFAADQAKLDSGYLGGIARAISAEQAAGRLDGVLLFESEKERVESGKPMPGSDDDNLPASLKELRSVYRTEFSKLQATRASNLGELARPLNQHLEKMESDYTKAGKLDEAKAVRVYRLDLAAELIEMGGTSNPGAMAAPSGGIVEGKDAGESLEVGGIEMRWCPPGDFMMGSAADEPGRLGDESQVRTRLKNGFWLASTETTQKVWKRTMGTDPSYYKGDNLPAERISWNDATAYVARLNETSPLPRGWKWALPTEAQWEYACRAGSGTAFHTGDGIDETQAKIKVPGGAATTVNVGSYEPNAWGLHDMHGNVREWCADWHSNALPGGNDPAGPESGTIRVRRGGSWNHEVSACRSASRHKGPPDDSNSDLGVRIAILPAVEDN